MEDILVERELRATHLAGERRAEEVSTPKALLIGDGDLRDEGVQPIFVHLPEVHPEALEKLMSGMLHVVLVVGVIDDAL
jgi:hypothetical protein